MRENDLLAYFVVSTINSIPNCRKRIICIQGSEGNQPSECSNCGWYGTLTPNLSLLIEDNTELKFCNSQTKLFDFIHVGNKANVSLYGFSYSMTLILCQNSPGNGAGFRFTNISQLRIENLSFHGCGAIHNGSTVLSSITTKLWTS